MSRMSNRQNFVDFRKRRSYTLEEKLEIIKELEGGAKQAQVAEAKQIAASTVQNIWSTRDRVLGDYRRVRNHTLRKIPRNPRSCHVSSSGVGIGGGGSKVEYGDVEKALMQWYTRSKRTHPGLTAPIIKAKALQISKQFGHYDFKATVQWLAGWQGRYGVTLPLPKISSETEQGNSLKRSNGNLRKDVKKGQQGQIQEPGEDVEEGEWPVEISFGDEEEDGEEVVDASAFMIQNHQEEDEYNQQPSKPIKEIRNGVEVIYRSRGSRGGRYKSYIWKYFREQEEEVDGGTLRYVECGFCNNRVSPKAGRMEKHLQSCEFCPEDISQELGLNANGEFAKASHNDIISSTMDDKEDEMEIETDITEEIPEDNSQNGMRNQEQEASSSNCSQTGVMKKRRTFHWKRISTYKNIEEAELALGDLSMWSRKHKHRTQQGIKTYYGCKFGRHCPVQMHLLFETRTKRVIMFQTMEEHCHISKIKRRGLPSSAEKPIRQLYNEGITKPSHIQLALDEDGEMEVPPRYQIAYFLEKIRREESIGGIGAMTTEHPTVKVESCETVTIPGCGDEILDNWYDESRNGDESSEIQILPYFTGGDEVEVDSMQNWTDYPTTVSPMIHSTSTSSNSNSARAANLFKSAIKLSPKPNEKDNLGQTKNDITIYPATPAAQASNPVSTLTVTEIPASTQYCTFRDETTKDGDIIAPGEMNVKRKVINFIEKNFSNRDFLQIHRELQSLKDGQKFTSLIRLASFTSGFLQTAFLDQQDGK